MTSIFGKGVYFYTELKTGNLFSHIVFRLKLCGTHCWQGGVWWHKVLTGGFHGKNCWQGSIFLHKLSEGGGPLVQSVGRGRFGDIYFWQGDA